MDWTCRIALAQTNPELGNLHGNLEDHLARIDEAAASGAALVLFPELSLTGYFLKDQTFELALERESPVLAQLARRSDRIAVGVGFVERSRDGRYYNAYAFFEGGRLAHVHRKVHLVSYGMFEEARDLASGESFEAFDTGCGRFGILICEDLWHLPSAYLHFLQGVDAILVPSSGPARGVGADGDGLESVRTWSTLLSAVALFTRTWVVYVNRVGWEDGIGFAGQSCVIDPSGERVAAVEGLEPALAAATIDGSLLRRARVEAPLLRDEKPWLLAAELLRVRPELRRLRAPLEGSQSEDEAGTGRAPGDATR